MKIISASETEQYENGETCVVSEYRLEDDRIDAAVAKIDGRYPDAGWVRNTESKEIAYVLSGIGKLICEEEERLIAKGDVVLIEPNEKFYWEGKMELLISCTPAWKYAQYEHIDG